MDSQRSDTGSDDSNPASSVSPTPTVRDIRSSNTSSDRRAPTHVPAPIHTGSQVQHQDLGMGRPDVSLAREATRATLHEAETSNIESTTFRHQLNITRYSRHAVAYAGAIASSP